MNTVRQEESILILSSPILFLESPSAFCELEHKKTWYFGREALEKGCIRENRRATLLHLLHFKQKALCERTLVDIKLLRVSLSGF